MMIVKKGRNENSDVSKFYFQRRIRAVLTQTSLFIPLGEEIDWFGDSQKNFDFRFCDWLSFFRFSIFFFDFRFFFSIFRFSFFANQTKIVNFFSTLHIFVFQQLHSYFYTNTSSHDRIRYDLRKSRII